MLVLEVDDQGMLETIENEGISMLINYNYHQWKENMKSNLMNHDVSIQYVMDTPKFLHQMRK